VNGLDGNGQGREFSSASNKRTRRADYRLKLETSVNARQLPRSPWSRRSRAADRHSWPFLAAGGMGRDAAKRRMPYLEGIPLLDLSDAVNDLAKAIMESGLLPPKAARDAIHIAVSSVHGVDILLTWNCTHIANAAIMKELREVIEGAGYSMPILCTPEELSGE